MLLYSHNPHSQGAKRLARTLGIRRIKHINTRFRGRLHPYVINWGSADVPAWSHRCRMLNHPDYVKLASCKLSFFETMGLQNVDLTPPWTIDREEAQEWLDDDKVVVERHVLNGHGGIGIRIRNPGDELRHAPLYVQYIKKASEYRVHMFGGQEIDIQRKVKREGAEPVDWHVRNLDNGFVYQRWGIEPNAQILEAAEKAMEASGLLFGGVDVVWNERHQRAYVLEINTAPGLEGQTVDSYASAFRAYTRANNRR